jgi:hypothetical protein
VEIAYPQIIQPTANYQGTSCLTQGSPQRLVKCGHHWPLPHNRPNPLIHKRITDP